MCSFKHNAGLRRRGSVQTPCYSFGIHLREDSNNIRTVQGLPGCKDVKMTLIYTPLANPGWMPEWRG
jgi:site-specific recombinase XerC